MKKNIYLTPCVCNERILDGLQAAVPVKQNILEQDIDYICSPFSNASFGTFCIQIGQFLESQLAFEDERNFLFSIDFASKTSKQRF